MSHTNIKLYGTAWCSDCKRTKKFLGEQRVHYEFIDVDQDAAGLAVVERVNHGKHIIPTLVLPGGAPAGLTAALYAAREGIETLVIERGGVGGQAGITERLDNFPGFPEGISGGEFADRLRRQAERFGVEILSAQEVTGVDEDGAYRIVRTADGAEYRAYAVL